MAMTIFQVTSIDASMSDKNIHIKFSKDVDPATISAASISLYNKTLNQLEVTNLKVSKNLVTVKFESEPAPNVEYELYVQPVIKSLIEELTLDMVVSRTIIFKSEVTSNVVILSPANYEKFENETLKFSWQEFGAVKENNFRLQISDNNKFLKPIFDTFILGKTETDFLFPLTAGQYYLRIRAEKENADDFSKCGRWSEPITFLTSDYETALDINLPNVDDNADWNTLDENNISIEDRTEEEKPAVTAECEKIYELMPENIKILFSEKISTDTAVINIFRRDV